MRLLVVRNDKLGDFITALPTLYALKSHDPSTHIAVVVAPLNTTLAHASPFIDEVIVDHGEGVLALAYRLRGFDVSITLFSTTRLALAQALARIPRRIAPATKIAQIFYTHRIIQRRSRSTKSEWEYNLDLASTLYPSMSRTFPMPLLHLEGSQERYEALRMRYDLRRPLVMLHAGSGGSSDANWSLEEYILLARHLQKRGCVEVMMSFGPDEEGLYARAQELVSSTIHLYHAQGSVVEFAQILTHTRLFISTSTGTYHLANAVGCETITFFADTTFASAKRWKSIGAHQHHFMLPPTERTHCWEEVLSALDRWCDTLVIP